jgi:two-component system NtrC family sensor kinase
MTRSNLSAPASKLNNAVNLTRLLVIASLAGPAVIFGLIGWLTYQSAFATAQRELTWTSDVAREHASKVFDSYKLVADRVQDLLDHIPDPQIRAAEQSYHDSFRKIIQGLPQIESLVVLDRNAHLLVATVAFPVSPETDFSDRDYFVALKRGKIDSFISVVQEGRVSGTTFFGWAQPRRDASGGFDGVINIALSPAFFMGFYETLVRDIGRSAEGRVVTLIRTDGQILVRHPALPGTIARVPAANPFFAAVARSPEGGTYTNTSVIDLGAPQRLFAFRKVPGHPIYVVAGRSTASIVSDWRRGMLRYAMAVVPATLALLLLSLATFRGARREQMALTELRVEMGRRESIEEQLRQAQKVEAIGQLAGGIAHDFNNLLMVIASSTNFLRRPDLPSERRARYIDAISEAAGRGAKLTGQLLAFARRQALRPEVFETVANLRNIMEMVRTLTGSGIVLNADWPESELHVNADPTQLDTSIINLATNARDAMNGRGELLLSVSDVTEVPPDEGQPGIQGSYVAIAMTDSGAGISPAQLKHIFEPFFTTKAVGQGTGLGLSQVFGFVKQSGGEVRVQSRVGQGTTITLFLPLVAAKEQESKPPLDLLADCRGMSVLLVEDNDDVRRATIDNLRDLGCNIEAVANGAEALTVLADRAGKFDVMFSDIVMPGMNGVELRQKVRELSHGPQVLLTSGYSDMLVHREPDDFEVLQKPYSIAQLSNALRQASASRRRDHFAAT